MPNIFIPDDVYDQLGRRARPFESPGDVIKRLLDLTKGEEMQRPGSYRSGKPRLHTLRGAVINRWENEAKPTWDLNRTIQVCKEEDDKFRRKGENPTPKFREGRDRRDEYYVSTWVSGCHFPWLNPRMKP